MTSKEKIPISFLQVGANFDYSNPSNSLFAISRSLVAFEAVAIKFLSEIATNDATIFNFPHSTLSPCYLPTSFLLFMFQWDELNETLRKSDYVTRTRLFSQDPRVNISQKVAFPGTAPK